MKQIPFVKMQAQGNDFIILDGRTSEMPELEDKLITALADRRLGIGCDQVLVLLADKQADAGLRVFNSDGSEAENCGNGLRCVGHLLLEENASTTVNIRIYNSTFLAEKAEDGIRVHMGAAQITGRTETHVDVDMGNPHSVFFEAIETFPEDRNVEIVSGQVADHIYVDIIERGAGHTPACGSGACAVAAAVWTIEKHQRPLTIHMSGGEVGVSGKPEDIVLTGPVCLVFSGQYDLPVA